MFAVGAEQVFVFVPVGHLFGCEGDLLGAGLVAANGRG
jgi:hypothetical protein